MLERVKDWTKEHQKLLGHLLRPSRGQLLVLWLVVALLAVVIIKRVLL